MPKTDPLPSMLEPETWSLEIELAMHLMEKLLMQAIPQTVFTK